MSTETVPVVMDNMQRCIDMARQSCDDILALGSEMAYADKVWMRNDVTGGLGWVKHYHRVLLQHDTAGWDITPAWDLWKQYNHVMQSYAGLVTEHLGMTPGPGVDPQARVDRVLGPKDLTASQKSSMWVSAGLFVVVTAFAVLLSMTDTNGTGGNSFAVPIELGYLFWLVMTVWFLWAGHYEKTHPNFKKARIVVGTVGAAMLVKKVYDAHEGAEERLRTGGYSL